MVLVYYVNGGCVFFCFSALLISNYYIPNYCFQKRYSITLYNDILFLKIIMKI